MSGLAWRLLLGLECRHGYFTDGVCRPLRALPSAACMTQLARYRMLWRPLPGGGEIHASAGALPDYHQGGALTLLLMCSDRHLMNYTGGLAVPAAESLPSVWYFDNLQSRHGVLNPAGGGAPQRLPLMGHRFQWTPPPDATAGSLMLCDALGQTVCELAPQATVLDLSPWDEGRYAITFHGAVLLDFYLCDATPTGLWGLCALYAGGRDSPVPDEGAAIGADGSVNPRRYQIALNSRTTHWRYTLVAPDASFDYTRWTVSGERRATQDAKPDVVDFSHTPQILLVDGRQAARFTSLQPLPLGEHPADTMRFTLHTGSAMDGHAGNLRLPYAQGRALVQTDAATPLQQYSDIYVYL